MTNMPEMPLRKLGRDSGIVGSALGFGCMSLTPGFYGSDMDIEESEKVLRKALDLGCSVLNTADFYGHGDCSNIKLIGKVLKDYNRSKIILVTKWGPWFPPGEFILTISPEDCRRRIHEALKHLGTDYIDVLVLRLVPSTDVDIPIEAAAKEMKALLDEGKVKAIGVSEGTVDQIRTIHSIVPVSVLEEEWSLFSREVEKELVPLAREIGAGIQAYSPLGRGILTGKVTPDSLAATDIRKTRLSRFKQESYDANMQLIRKLEAMAAKKDCTVAQLALAWVLAQGDDVIPIPGTKRIKCVEENVGALKVKLSPDEVQEMCDMVPEDVVAGSRH